MNFVLVHGAWHGGWCWGRVANALESHGHRAFAPTLRGLAHRRSELSLALSADSHVDDIADLVDLLDLQEVVLVLHSYAGMLGPALLQRLRARLVHVAWVEAVLPMPGQCLFDLIAGDAAARYRQAAKQGAEGLAIPPPDVAQFGMADAALRAEVAARLTPQPLRSFAEPVQAAQADVMHFDCSYLIASDRDPQPYAGFAQRARAAHWPVRAVPGGHLLMLSNPDALVDFLLCHAMRGRAGAHGTRL